MSTEHGMNSPLACSLAPSGKKKPGGMNIFRAAWLRRRRCHEKKAGGSVSSDPSSKGMLNKVVGSIRPLHLQGHRSPQHPRVLGSTAPPSTNEQYEDMVSSPVSTPGKMTSSPSRSTASEEGMSRFASAVNLADLDSSGEEDGDHEHDDDIKEGDESIDIKAEEFIAQFYQQMRTQNYNRRVRMSSRK